MTKPRIYASAESLLEQANLYFVHCGNYCEEAMSAKGDIVYIHRPQTPTIEGFCSYVGILRRTFADYTKTPDLGQACELIRERILAFKMGSLVNGRGHASGLIFDITNNHKGEYQHVSKVDNNNSGEVKIIIERERNAGIQNKNEGAARESMEGD